MNIKFLRGTLAQYLACTKSLDTLYFITDTGALYLGEKLIGKDYESAITALQNAGYQNAAQVGELISAALANYYTKGEVDNLLAGLGVAAIAGRVEAIEKDYLKAADKTELEGKINDKVSLEGYVAYSEAEKSKLAGLENYNDAEVRGLISGNTTEIAAVKVIAEAARTEEEVNGQIDSKIAALDLANTYEAKGAEERAKSYVDGKVEVINGRLDTAESNIGTLQEQIQGLSGAMHFKGIYPELPVTTSPIAQGDSYPNGMIIKIDTSITPQIEGYFDLVEENSYFDFVKAPGYYYPIEFVRYDGNAFAIYEGITGGKILLYVSEDVSEEKLAELGATTRGWQVSEFRWRAGGPISFVGYNSANPVITDNTCPFFLVERVDGDFVTGDVIAVGDKEYVFNGNNFVEFGDISAEGQRLAALEGKVEAIEAKPAMGILSTDISAWNNEIGAKELAGSKATLAEVKAYVEGEKFAKDADLDVVEGKLEGLTGTVKDYVDGEIAKVDAAGVNSEITGIKNRLDTAESDIDAAEGRLDVIERDYAKSADVESVYLKKADETIYNDSELRGRVEGLEGKVDITGKVSEYVAAEVKKTDDKLANYVEKEGYIAYTQEEKNKLAGLNNYNDSEVRGLISGIDGRVSTVEGKLNGVANVSEAIAAALAEAKKYADDNDANTEYDDTAVRGLISGIDTRVGLLEVKPAMGITADHIASWNGKATLEEVKTAFIGETSVKLIDVVAAVNKLYDGSEGVNNELKSMNQNVKALEGALTWGEIK